MRLDIGSAQQRERVRAVLSVHRPILVLVVIGVALRVYLLVAYRPVAAGFNDSVTYLFTSKDHLFSDASRMAGYPFALRIARYVYPNLSFVVVLQHVLGVATAVLLYLTVRRITGGRWLPLIPAGLVLLSGDYLLLEHSILTETLYLFLVTAAIAAVVIGLAATAQRTALVLLASGGLSLGAAATVRSVGLPVVFYVFGWLLFTTTRVWRKPLRFAAAFAIPAAAVVTTYVILQGTLTGFWGVLRASGWGLYPRVAAIADCHDFKPPSHTAFLCESTPPVTRPGPDYYQYVGGPAIARFGSPFQTNGRGSRTLSRFARAVIRAEPFAYLREVGRDMVRFIDPTAGLDRPYAGPGSDELDLARRQPEVEQATVEAARSVGFAAGAVKVSGGVGFLAELQPMFRVSGAMLVALLFLACAPVVGGRGRVRATSVLFLGCAILQPLVAVATLSWAYRYGVVASADLAAAAALGIHFLANRRALEKTS